MILLVRCSVVGYDGVQVILVIRAFPGILMTVLYTGSCGWPGSSMYPFVPVSEREI